MDVSRVPGGCVDDGGVMTCRDELDVGARKSRDVSASISLVIVHHA